MLISQFLERWDDGDPLDDVLDKLQEMSIEYADDPLGDKKISLLYFIRDRIYHHYNVGNIRHVLDDIKKNALRKAEKSEHSFERKTVRGKSYNFHVSQALSAHANRQLMQMKPFSEIR